MEQEEQPSFRRYVEDRRYYEVPARFAMHTAYMEVPQICCGEMFFFMCVCVCVGGGGGGGHLASRVAL